MYKHLDFKVVDRHIDLFQNARSNFREIISAANKHSKIPVINLDFFPTYTEQQMDSRTCLPGPISQMCETMSELYEKKDPHKDLYKLQSYTKQLSELSNGRIKNLFSPDDTIHIEDMQQ